MYQAGSSSSAGGTQGTASSARGVSGSASNARVASSSSPFIVRRRYGFSGQGAVHGVEQAVPARVVAGLAPGETVHQIAEAEAGVGIGHAQRAPGAVVTEGVGRWPEPPLGDGVLEAE